MLQEFGDGSGDVGLNSALSQMYRGDSPPYTNPKPRLPSLLAFCYFAGDLRLTGNTATLAGQGDRMFLKRDARHVDSRQFGNLMNDFFTYIAELDSECQTTAKMSIMHGEDGVELWKATTKPDGCVAPPGARGHWSEIVTEERPLANDVCSNEARDPWALPQKGLRARHRSVYALRVYSPFPCLVLQVMRNRAAVIYSLSGGAGKSLDSENTVLQMLMMGAILSVAREARAREHENTATPPNQALLAKLRDPVLVVGLPKGWETERNNLLNRTELTSRVWSFLYTDEGVRVNRSECQSIRGALSFMMGGVLKGRHQGQHG